MLVVIEEKETLFAVELSLNKIALVVGKIMVYCYTTTMWAAFLPLTLVVAV